MNEVPDEKAVTYNPNQYLTPNKDVNKTYPPSKFTQLDKSTYNEGWLLHMSEESSGEWRVA